jgi:nucleotide-binding universal stress UspA family protein
MYERILVPLDGSDVAEAIIPDVEDLVLKMAPVTRVDVVLLQVVSVINFNVLTDNVEEQIRYSEKDMKQITEKVQEYLEKIATPMREKDISVTTMVSVGHAAEEILKAASEANADLIAMSTHGRSGLRLWALGSITDKVLHESKIPVLTIRAIHNK